MTARLLLLLIALSLMAPRADACSVSGCAEDEGAMPLTRFRVLDSTGLQLSLFDSSVDEALTMPNFLRTAMPDGSLVIEYLGDDRREAYGDGAQSLSVQFSDILPPDKIGKHPEGRAERVPVGAAQDVVNWTGRATFFTISGIVEDGEGTQSCGWFCRLDLNWSGSFPNARPSLSRIKANYDSSD